MYKFFVESSSPFAQLVDCLMVPIARVQACVRARFLLSNKFRGFEGFFFKKEVKPEIPNVPIFLFVTLENVL